MTAVVHETLDRATTLSGLLMPDHRKYFAETLDGASVAEHLDDLSVETPSVTREGVQELRAHTRVGVLDPACLVVRWYGPERPSLIVHHGNNERPFAFGRTAKNVLGRAVMALGSPEVNVVILRAPFHAGSLREFMDAMGSIDRFTAMLTTSVELAERVRRSLRDTGSPRVSFAGVSLGGWVVNLHRTHYNTADTYLPIFAGAALAEVFLTSSYRRLTSRRALAEPARLRALLNFEEAFAAVPDANVVALLARFDQYIDYDRQRSCYGPHPVTTLARGHVTGSLGLTSLRRHVLSHASVGWSPAAHTGVLDT